MEDVDRMNENIINFRPAIRSKRGGGQCLLLSYTSAFVMHDCSIEEMKRLKH